MALAVPARGQREEHLGEGEAGLMAGAGARLARGFKAADVTN